MNILDLCFAELDLDYLDEVRRNQPVFQHRRSDLYSLYFNEKREINGLFSLLIFKF
jgi:hypothetical protein